MRIAEDSPESSLITPGLAGTTKVGVRMRSTERRLNSANSP